MHKVLQLWFKKMFFFVTFNADKKTVATKIILLIKFTSREKKTGLD